jgi:hypothetical protein
VSLTIKAPHIHFAGAGAGEGIFTMSGLALMNLMSDTPISFATYSSLTMSGRGCVLNMSTPMMLVELMEPSQPWVDERSFDSNGANALVMFDQSTITFECAAYVAPEEHRCTAAFSLYRIGHFVFMYIDRIHFAGREGPGEGLTSDIVAVDFSMPTMFAPIEYSEATVIYASCMDANTVREVPIMIHTETGAISVDCESASVGTSGDITFSPIYICYDPFYIPPLH